MSISFQFKNILIYSVLVGCANQPNETRQIADHVTQSLPTINVGQVDDEPEDFPLSELVTDVEIIPLERKPNCLIGDETWAMDAGDFFIIRSGFDLFRFGKDGKFLNKIGSTGKGPGEHTSPAILYARYYETDNVIMALWLIGNPQLFKPDGTFICDLKPPFTQKPLERLSDSIWFVNGSWSGNRRSPIDSTILTFFDVRGNVLTRISRSLYPDKEGYSPRNGSLTMNLSFDEPFVSSSNGSVKFYMAGNDTIYNIVDMKLTPLAIVDAGRYRIPYNSVIKPTEMEGKAQFNILRETDNTFFMEKLNPTVNEQKAGREVNFSKTPPQLVIYNKLTGKAKNVRVVDDVLGLITDEFVVAEYWAPIKRTFYLTHANWKGKNPVIIAPAIDILKRIDNLNISKLPDSTKAKLKILESLSEESNPVMFVLKLKSEVNIK
jgi:hypothetical protein